MEEPEEEYYDVNEDEYFEEYPDSAYEESNKKAFEYIIKKTRNHPKLARVYGLFHFNYSRPKQYYIAYALVFGLLDWSFDTIALFTLISIIICAEYANLFSMREEVIDRCFVSFVMLNYYAQKDFEPPCHKSDADDVLDFEGFGPSDIVPFKRKFIVYKSEYLKILAIHAPMIIFNLLYYFFALKD